MYTFCDWEHPRGTNTINSKPPSSIPPTTHPYHPSIQSQETSIHPSHPPHFRRIKSSHPHRTRLLYFPLQAPIPAVQVRTETVTEAYVCTITTTMDGWPCRSLPFRGTILCYSKSSRVESSRVSVSVAAARTQHLDSPGQSVILQHYLPISATYVRTAASVRMCNRHTDNVLKCRFVLRD